MLGVKTETINKSNLSRMDPQEPVDNYPPEAYHSKFLTQRKTNLEKG